VRLAECLLHHAQGTGHRADAFDGGDGEAVGLHGKQQAGAHGLAITTIEGVSPMPGTLSVVQEAFCEAHGLQCGYGTPGMVLVGHALLAEKPHPTHADIVAAIGGNLCRCTGYAQIIEAIALAASRLRAAAREGG
jgi:carbon-monoxide dehydrogenase small subunit